MAKNHYGICGVLFGNCGNGGNCGLLNLNGNNGLSNANWTIAAREYEKLDTSSGHRCARPIRQPGLTAQRSRKRKIIMFTAPARPGGIRRVA